jgi:hypothetical protein
LNGYSLIIENRRWAYRELYLVVGVVARPTRNTLAFNAHTGFAIMHYMPKVPFWNTLLKLQMTFRDDAFS